MRYTGEECLALPKLNLQFLTYHDYMLRNFHLFRLESTYEIREDVSKFVARLRPKLANNMKGMLSHRLMLRQQHVLSYALHACRSVRYHLHRMGAVCDAPNHVYRHAREEAQHWRGQACHGQGKHSVLSQYLRSHVVTRLSCSRS